MKIAILINQSHKEHERFTTTLLALKALERGHTVIYIGLADFIYEGEKNISAHCRILTPAHELRNDREFIKFLKAAKKEKVNMKDIDVLWLRFDPTLDMINRPWAAASGVQFAQLIKKMGKLVINDPDNLVEANNKLYLENFPKAVRPKTLVTRNHEDVERFLDAQKDKIILKPLKGSGGKNVFMIDFKERQNLKQTVEAIARDGYIIAQEYLHEATKGDIRFFLLDGKPLMVDGEYAAVRRVQQENEIRSNIHQGATAEKAEITEDILKLVKQVSTQLKKDEMYLVGLDIVGDKIMEVNVFSPGALNHATELFDRDFAGAVIENLEKKVKKYYK
ncbi:ATP-grasp domain-containing protein [Sphingobacterium lactis]|uniref:Glutathione synthase n=1 Tax=Sphingobacterium lactis TaxID=797291 RepID=A0A1H6C099_9SPHI|nr:glutathione synthetase [Sphingobacterium lactis]SEG66105.1 glutathione synthase [Sphingobacterium lactis]